jgi:hypothetical protein
MVGRYVNHEMRVFDRAVVRFGNVAMLPEVVWQEDRGYNQESFLVDMRSISGFSGSQVIVYYATTGSVPIPDSNVTLPGLDGERDIIGNAWLLGVDWGHLPVGVDLKDKGKNVIGRMAVNSGMAGVVPAWKLGEILDQPKIRAAREKAEAEILAARESSMGGVLDVLDEPSPPEEFAAFEDLTDRLLRVPKKELDEKLAES